MALAALIVRIGADLSELNKGLTQVERDLQKVGKRLTKMGSALTQNLTVPITAAAAAMGAAAITVGSFADSLLDLVDATGLSTDTLQEFRHVALVAGVESDTLANATIKLTSALSAGDEQSKQMSDALKRLGVSATDGAGRLKSMDVLMPSIIGRLQGMQDTTLRNTIAADIFGKSWAELAPILGLGAGAMEKARKEAHALGLVMSKENVEAADRFRQSFDKLKATGGAIVREFGIAVLPIMEGLTEMLQKHVVPAVRSMVKWFQDLSPATKTTIGVVAGLAAAFGPLLVVVGSILTMWPLIAAAFAAVTGPIGLTIIAIGALTAAGIQLINNWDAVKAQFILAWTAMKDAVFTSVSKIVDVLIAASSILPGLSNLTSGLIGLKLSLEDMAANSLASGIAKVTALEQKMLASANATTTFASSVTKLSNALAGLPSKKLPGNITLPGLTRGMTVGVGSDFTGNLGRGPADPVRLNTPTPGTPGAPAAPQGSGIGSAIMGQMPQIVQAFAAFGPIAAILPVISGAMETLGPVVTKLIEPLVEVGRIIGEALAPVLEMLTPAVQLIADLFIRQLAPILKVVTIAFSYVMEALGWLVRGIGKLIDAIPGISAKGIINAGQAMMDAARAARENSSATDDATKAVNAFASSLSNIPRVLNVNALRHLISGTVPPDRNDPVIGRQPTGTKPGGETARGMTTGGNITYNITINGATDPVRTAEELERRVDRTQKRGGITRFSLVPAT